METKRIRKLKKVMVKSRLTVRLVVFFLFLLITVVVIFEAFSIISLQNYYYSNTAGILSSQARFNSDLYLSYLSGDTLSNVVIKNKNQFYRTNKTQVQLLDNSGRVLYDSIGSMDVGKTLTTDDVVEAQVGNSKIYTGHVDYDTEPVMSLSHPLYNQSKQVGIIRLTTSLRGVNQEIRSRVNLFIGFGIIVILVTLLMAIIAARTIVKPIKNLTRVANKLADGQFQVKANESRKDEIGELASTMNLMSENILKKEQLKNDFISSVSHELRTPLTSIKGWAITLQAGNMSKEMNLEGLKIIEKESDRLSSMVEDLLDFSRFSSGRIMLKKTTFDLIVVTQNILYQFQPRVRSQNLNLVFNYSQPTLEITADVDRIKQVLLNIVDNAIKFTPEDGTIIVDIDHDEFVVNISVTDTGIGISEDEINLVTEKFWKGSSSASHTGLGLSICEEIAKAHGGKLKINSRLGTGTTVTCVLRMSSV